MNQQRKTDSRCTVTISIYVWISRNAYCSFAPALLPWGFREHTTYSETFAVASFILACKQAIPLGLPEGSHHLPSLDGMTYQRPKSYLLTPVCSLWARYHANEGFTQWAVYFEEQLRMSCQDSHLISQMRWVAFVQLACLRSPGW